MFGFIDSGLPFLLGHRLRKWSILDFLRRSEGKHGLWGLQPLKTEDGIGFVVHPGQCFAESSLIFPRDFLSEDENDKKQNPQSSDESFEPYPEKK